MQFTEIISIIGLSLGALMGLGAMASPRWASGVVRLIADPAKPGGYSEFRGTYGGLFFMVHASALLIVLITPPAGSALAALPVAAGWLGAAFGRTLSLIFDRELVAGAKIIPIWMATEVGLGLAIGAPVLHLLS